MKIFQFSAFQHFLRLCFSFSCSGFDFKLIKEPHIKLLFVFIKVPIKNKKLKNSLLVTVVAECYKETTNTEKVIYFLSLMSCSINELKSQMFPHVKTMGFKILRGKIFFCSSKWWWFLCGPDNRIEIPIQISMCKVFLENSFSVPGPTINQIQHLFY